jgi:hypothetical protein
MGKRVIVCPRCGFDKPHYAKGFCNSCYKRVFYPRPNPGARKKDLPLMLAQLLGATEAARRVGVDVEAFKAWVTGSVKPSAEEERAIRNLIEISRKAERDG